MVLSQHRRAVGIFKNRIDAERALNDLNSAGFTRDQISVVAIDHDDLLNKACTRYHVENLAQEETGNCATIAGSMIGAIGGCLVGLGLLAMPGVGLVVAIGTSGTALATTLAGAGIGAASGGLIGALTNSGMTSNEARVGSDRKSQGEYLVMVNGTDQEVHRAESILRLCFRCVWADAVL